MRHQIATVATALSLLAPPLIAQPATKADVDTLFDALGLPEMIAIMREEGLAYGDTLAADMLPGGPTPDWASTVSGIYDLDAMTGAISTSFTTALTGEEIGPILDFFTSDVGQKIITLEIDARRAMLDEAVEEAAKEQAALAAMDETPRYLQVQAFIAANDLIENNVVGALNSSYAFYMGLIDGGAMPPGVTPDTALQDVWSQEAEIRQSTEEWAYSFFLLAHDPLTDDELDQYIAFSESEPGNLLTDALFTAFNGTFDGISRDLGLAISLALMSQDI